MHMERIEKVTVMRITPLEGAGSVKAFATIRVGVWEIHSMRIIKQEGAQPWVSFPTQVVEGKDGEKSYFQIVKVLDENKRENIKAAVLAAYKNSRMEET